MTCYESDVIKVGETWNAPQAHIKHIILYSTNTGRVSIDDGFGLIEEFGIVEHSVYEFPQAKNPFSLEILWLLYGIDPTRNGIMFKTCDIEPIEEPEEPEEEPTDFLGLLTYIKDKIVNAGLGVSALAATLLNHEGIITGIRDTLNPFITLVETKFVVLNTQYDALSGTLDTLHDNVILGISDKLELYKTDIISAINEIEFGDPGEILDPIRAEFTQLGHTISDEIISKVWDYIESQLFEDDD